MENYKRRGSLFLLWEMTISRNLCFPALVILSLVSTFPVEQQKKRKSAVSHVEWFWHLPDVYLVFRFSDRIPPIGTETGSRCAYSTVYSPGSRGKSGWNSRFSRPLTEEKVNFVPFFREKKIGTSQVAGDNGDLSKETNWFSWTSHCHKQPVNIKSIFSLVGLTG